MTVRVLVADEDLDVHELVNDILSISFKDVSVDRVLTGEGLYRKIRATKQQYNLIIISLKLHDNQGKSLAFCVCRDFPEYCKRIAIIKEPSEQRPAEPLLAAVPCLEKPFSLDTFSEIIKKLVA